MLLFSLKLPFYTTELYCTTETRNTRHVVVPNGKPPSHPTLLNTTMWCMSCDTVQYGMHSLGSYFTPGIAQYLVVFVYKLNEFTRFSHVLPALATSNLEEIKHMIHVYRSSSAGQLSFAGLVHVGVQTSNAPYPCQAHTVLRCQI